MAAVTTNTDTRPAKRGSIDVLESGDHSSIQKPGAKGKNGGGVKLILQCIELYIMTNIEKIK